MSYENDERDVFDEFIKNSSVNRSSSDKREILEGIFTDEEDLEDDDSLPDDPSPLPDMVRTPPAVLNYDDSLAEDSYDVQDEDDVFSPADSDYDDEEDDYEDDYDALLNSHSSYQSRESIDKSDGDDGSSSSYVGDDDIDNIINGVGGDLYDDDDDDDERDQWSHIKIDEILAMAVDMKASDVHILPDRCIWFTIHKRVKMIDSLGVIPHHVVDRMKGEIANAQTEQRFAINMGTDSSYTLRSGRHQGVRTRVNFSNTGGHTCMTFRIISSKIPDPDSIGANPLLRKWVDRGNGMVLVCGSTGSGKSTTFASLVNEVLQRHERKIISLENPIEYVYNDGAGVIVQKELGEDIKTFSDGIKFALREHPQMILVGEIRDREEVDEFLRASESGHFAMSTMHTRSPEATISRIVNLYEGEERRSTLMTLHDQLVGVVNQALVRTKDGKGLICISCALPVNKDVRPMVVEGDTYSIRKYMMDKGITMEHSLVDSYMHGDCHYNDLLEVAPDQEYFDYLLEERGVLESAQRESAR